MAYARQRMYLSHTSTLENSAWYTHIRRFHRRNEDALAQGSQVDEWNNPHSNMFGDQIGFSQVLPYNTVQFGGYLIHEVYNPHNLFYNPADGGSGAQQIVGAGSKFRSGYFQQDNVTFFAQDDIHPIPRIHIIPSVRVDGFSTSYSDQAARDFTFAPSTYFAANPDGTVSATNGSCLPDPLLSEPADRQQHVRSLLQHLRNSRHNSRRQPGKRSGFSLRSA